MGSFRIFSNPELGPEKGWSAEAGIKQGFILGTVSGYLDLAAFWTQYQDMIEYTFGYFPPDTLLLHPSEYVGYKALNIENARIMGLEASVICQGNIGPVELYFTAGYTLMDPVDPVALDSIGREESESYILKYRRKHLFKSDLNLEFMTLSAGVNVQYHSRMIRIDEFFTDDLLGNLIMPGFPDYWENEAGDYILMDVRLGWAITESIRITGILQNANNME